MTFAKRPLAGSSRAGGAAPAAASWRALAFLPPALLGLAAVWLPYLPNEAGRIGEDYSMWLPNLLAGFYWHVQNGFFSVPWFNPAQCGGIPVQADPQGEYFSLAQFLTFAVPPLRAVQSPSLPLRLPVTWARLCSRDASG